MSYINIKACKELIKSLDRRAGKEFLDVLNKDVERNIHNACEVHNGGKKTLDAAVAGYVGIKG
jgi:ribosomal protein S17E